MEITLIDFDKVGFDCDYLYVTPTMHEDDEPLAYYVSYLEFMDLINECELNQYQTDVDVFIKTSAWDYLVDNWSEVKDRYWLEFLKPELEKIFKSMKNLKVTIDYDLKLSIKDVASLFCSMSPIEQAEFFNEVGAYVKDWNKPFAFNMQAIADLESTQLLTNKGKQIMIEIGLFAKEREVNHA